MTSRFAVTVHTPEKLLNFEYVLAGLFELERRGIVALRIALDFGMPERGCNTTRCIVEDTVSGNRKVVLFDTRDAAGAYMPKYWEGVDCYFKRSFEKTVLEREVPAAHRHKFHSMGLCVPVRSRHEHDMWRCYAAELGYTWLASRSKRPRSIRRDVIQPLRERIRGIRARARVPYIDQLETPAEPPASEAIVLYQTRVFPTYADEHPEFAASKAVVNQQRASLVRRLRAELGERFAGGIVPDEYSNQHFRDVLTGRSTSRRDYLDGMQRARVVVYTEGLVGSAGWKLAEYLAAGRAIVMQRLPCELAEPLVDGRDALMFDTHDECVAACRGLLDDPARAEALGAAAQQYYRRWLDPAENVLRMLTVAAA